MDFKYKKAGTIFNMHSYWTKQPIPQVRFFIEKYSKKDELVFDPFAGTGMTGVAAIQSNRKVILNDISPIALHIAKGYCTDHLINKRSSTILKQKEEILKDLKKHYLTGCNKCNKKVLIRFSIVGETWQSKNGEKRERRGLLMLEGKNNLNFNKNFIFKEFELLKICYKCSCSKEKQYKSPDINDIENWKNKEYKNYFYPTENLIGKEPKRNYKKGIKKVYQLYSPRNLTTLSIIFNRINKIKDRKNKQLFLFIFTSILFNSSLMSRYRHYENTSIKMGTFYIPPLIKDTDVLTNFENKFKIITKGNKEIFKNNYKHKIIFTKKSAHKINNIKNDSIDYIYTDPPYSDIISYSELNIVFESWLKSKTKTKDEMIVSSHHGKDIEFYAKYFESFLKESYRILKKDGFITIIFHHPNIKHWNFFQKAIKNSELQPVVSHKPVRLVSSSKTSSQHKTKKNTQCFLVFNFKKNPNYSGLKLKKISNEEYKKIIEKSIEEAKKNGYNKNSDLFDFLINKLIFKYEIANFHLIN